MKAYKDYFVSLKNEFKAFKASSLKEAQEKADSLMTGEITLYTKHWTPLCYKRGNTWHKVD